MKKFDRYTVWCVIGLMSVTILLLAFALKRVDNRVEAMEVNQADIVRGASLILIRN